MLLYVLFGIGHKNVVPTHPLLPHLYCIYRASAVVHNAKEEGMDKERGGVS